MKEDPKTQNRLHDSFNITASQVIWAVREEMARTVEDFLSRRTRCLLLDARRSIDLAEPVAGIMASELHKDKKWIGEQVKSYSSLALDYLPV